MTHFAFDIPTLRTDRLILRANRESDLDAVAAFMASDRSHIIGGPRDRVDCWKMIAGNLGHWALRGYGFWTMEDAASGQPAGGVGFVFREGWEEPELGWHVYGGFEGQGLAFEAACAARDHGAAHFGLNGVVSNIDPKNARSRALAERMGARVEREGTLLGHPCLVYRHPEIARTA